jgi:hypothetical protein
MDFASVYVSESSRIDISILVLILISIFAT